MGEGERDGVAQALKQHLIRNENNFQLCTEHRSRNKKKKKTAIAM